MLALVVLSGCAKDPPPAATTPAARVGQLAGRVVDDANAPIRGAEVRILLLDLARTTDETGAYNFSRVPAGALRVVASADGFTSRTRSANLTAGSTLQMDFQLDPATRIVPYARTLTFNGRIECGLPQGAACPADMATGTTAQHRFPVDPFLVGIVVEVRWAAPNQQVNQQLAADMQAATAEACGQTYSTGSGPSVLRVEIKQGFPISGGHQCLLLRPPGDSPVIQQDYEAFVSLFYHDPPPPGFSAIA